jgi:hypothetical protein
VISTNDNVDMVMGWLRECDGAYQTCNSNRKPFSPIRLVNIGRGDLLRIELYLCQPLRYAALSYGLGSRKTEAPTTRANLAGRSAGFPETGLPQTLQDAIYVVRKLRIPYIWIDAFYIVQGDVSDLGKGSWANARHLPECLSYPRSNGSLVFFGWLLQ